MPVYYDYQLPPPSSSLLYYTRCYEWVEVWRTSFHLQKFHLIRWCGLTLLDCVFLSTATQKVMSATHKVDFTSVWSVKMSYTSDSVDAAHTRLIAWTPDSVNLAVYDISECQREVCDIHEFSHVRHHLSSFSCNIRCNCFLPLC